MIIIMIKFVIGIKILIKKKMTKSSWGFEQQMNKTFSFGTFLLKSQLGHNPNIW